VIVYSVNSIAFDDEALGFVVAPDKVDGCSALGVVIRIRDDAGG
jgi:hypothetical protein